MKPSGSAAQVRPTESPARPRPPRTVTVPPPEGMDPHLVSMLKPHSFEAEQYRTLRHVLERRHRTDLLSLVAVTSAGVGDGKTTTSLNLAGALAQAQDARVLVMDCDLRRPAVAQHLGLPDQGPGLAGLLRDPQMSLDQVVRRVEPFALCAVTSGRCPDSPYELLKSPRMSDVLDQVRRRFDYVILDTPPAVAFPDCRLMEKGIDGFLLVVSAHQTPRKLVEEALATMEPSKVLGLILNNDDRPLSGYYNYYGHYYGSGPGQEA
ncbi:MAG: CpsD/CapB family tyrosine-protein kinase [Candidatus Polarisedimenticolia bacterium]